MASHIRNVYFWEPKPQFQPNSVVLITGAASGIGKQVALVYAKRGCRLVLVDRDEQALHLLQPEIVHYGSECMILTVDVTSQQQCVEMVTQTINRWARIDIMVLCAGIGAHHLFEKTNDLTIFHKLMNVNFFGYLYCVHAAYRYLCESRGVLVAITSFSGEVGLPYRTAYCSSKFAVTGFLEALRSEMAVLSKEGGANSKTFDITIVCPPTVDTNLRRNSLTPDPTLKDKESSHAMTVEQCADAIVDAADRRLRKAFFPFKSWLASYLRPLIPDPIDSLIMKRAKL